MKLSKRLGAIASFIDSKDKVCDVGCDHGYLDIYLALNKKNKTIIATDISENVIKTTLKNIKEYKVKDKIKVYCTDGTKNIKEKYNTIILSGLGAYTIINIINNSPKVDKVIISSNNNWDLIRKHMIHIGYYINEELLIEENHKLYAIILFDLKRRKYSKKDILVGKYNKENIPIYKKIIQKNKDILEKIPYKNFRKRLSIIYINIILKRYLRKENRIIRR